MYTFDTLPDNLKQEAIKSLRAYANETSISVRLTEANAEEFADVNDLFFKHSGEVVYLDITKTFICKDLSGRGFVCQKDMGELVESFGKDFGEEEDEWLESCESGDVLVFDNIKFICQ